MSYICLDQPLNASEATARPDLASHFLIRSVGRLNTRTKSTKSPSLELGWLRKELYFPALAALPVSDRLARFQQVTDFVLLPRYVEGGS